MNEVTGAYYVPAPQQPPNLFAAYMASFLQTRAPYAEAVWKQRLAALDPYAKWSAMAQLAKISNDTYDAWSRAYQARISAEATGNAEQLRLTQTIIQDRTARAQLSAQMAIANQSAAVDLANKRSIKTQDGVAARTNADNLFGQFGQDGDLANFRNNLSKLAQDQAKLTDPGERDAVTEHVNGLLAQTTAGLTDAGTRDRLALEVRTLFPQVGSQATVQQLGGVGAQDYEGASTLAGRLAGTQTGGATGTASSGGTTSAGFPDPTEQLALQRRLREDLDKINPWDTLGWFGQPLRAPPEALAAYARTQQGVAVLQQARARARAATPATVPAPALPASVATGPAPPPAPPAPPAPLAPPALGSAPAPATRIPDGARRVGYPGTPEPYAYTPPRMSRPPPTASTAAPPPAVSAPTAQSWQSRVEAQRTTAPTPAPAPAPADIPINAYTLSKVGMPMPFQISPDGGMLAPWADKPVRLVPAPNAQPGAFPYSEYDAIDRIQRAINIGAPADEVRRMMIEEHERMLAEEGR